MDGVMAAGRIADRIRAARIARPGLERVVAPLAIGGADGMNGREIKHVESHRPDARQLGDHVAERAVLAVFALASGKQLVPAGEAGADALDVHVLDVTFGKE